MAEIHEKEHWADLYRRALFEEDGSKLPLMLERARQAVQQRVRELATRGQSVSAKERQDLHTAAYYLDLLRSLEVRKRIGDQVGTNEPMLPGLWTSET